jgi:hypothetical protein
MRSGTGLSDQQAVAGQGACGLEFCLNGFAFEQGKPC